MSGMFMIKSENKGQHTKYNHARRGSAANSVKLKLCLTAAALAWGLAGSAQTITVTTNFMLGAVIPDADKSGLASVQTLSTPITSVTSLKVSLKISGSWNGDLYCFLTHGSGHCVLLDRPGRTGASNFGYNDPGMDVTFDDAATNGDNQVYRLQLSGSQSVAIAPLTDAWAPDARVACPTNALETDARSAFLSSFNGVDPNGEWVLFVADLEAGDIHILENWALEITGDTSAKQLNATTPATAAVLTELTAGADGVKLTFRGSVGSTYQVERAVALQDSRTAWEKIGTATIDSAGQGTFTDPNPPVGQGYYRAVWQ